MSGTNTSGLRKGQYATSHPVPARRQLGIFGKYRTSNRKEKVTFAVMIKLTKLSIRTV